GLGSDHGDRATVAIGERLSDEGKSLPFVILQRNLLRGKRGKRTKTQMAHEIEVKVRVADLEGFRAALRRVGARVVGGGTGRVHEWNTLYDTVAEDLRGRDELLRIRVETRTGRDGRRLKRAERRVILTFKR